MIKKLAFLLCFVGISAVFAASNKEIETYITNNIKNNKSVTVKSVKVVSRESVKELEGWESVKVSIDVDVDRNGQAQNIKTFDTFFIKGDFLSPDLIDVKKNRTLKSVYGPKVTAEYYDSEHLIAGHKDAKYKITIFSDPLCPFCRDLVPDIIHAAVKNPSKLAVYHYSFPLIALHPASENIIKAEMSQRGKIKNKAEFFVKLYKTDIEPTEQNEEKIVAVLNAELGTKIQKSDLASKTTLREYEEEIAKARKLMIKGTPSIFVDGVIDVEKTKINQILKDLK